MNSENLKNNECSSEPKNNEAVLSEETLKNVSGGENTANDLAVNEFLGALKSIVNR